MEEAGKARGAAVGSKTQARRAQLQAEGANLGKGLGKAITGERPTEMPASLQGLVNRLGPAAGVELKEAQEGLAEVALPKELAAMRPLMDAQAWNRVLEERAMRLVQEETAERREQLQSYQRANQAAQGCAVGVEQHIKQRANDLGLLGAVAPEPQKGVWAELENLRHQVLKAHQTAEMLAERLGGVLVLVPEQDLVGDRVPGPCPPSRISEEVNLVAVSVVRLQDLLEGLLDRLDL